MPDTVTLTAFLIVAVTMAASPGPAVLYIVARGMHQGRAAALVSMLGIEVGTLVHVLGATLGLSAIFASSELTIAVVGYAGALYLVYLGVRTFAARAEAARLAAHEPRSLRRIFRQAVVVEVLNPKAALFVYALLPQFADSGSGAVAWEVLLLGVLFVVVATCVDGLYGLLAGSLGERLVGSARVVAAQRYITGSVYVGLAATTGLTATGL
jgi:threonine/homoserine/homoserine lactone efflux protein